MGVQTPTHWVFGCLGKGVNLEGEMGVVVFFWILGVICFTVSLNVDAGRNMEHFEGFRWPVCAQWLFGNTI